MLSGGQGVERDLVVKRYRGEDQNGVDEVFAQHVAPVPKNLGEHVTMQVAYVKVGGAKRVGLVSRRRWPGGRGLTPEPEHSGVIKAAGAQCGDTDRVNAGRLKLGDTSQMGGQDASAAHDAEP